MFLSFIYVPELTLYLFNLISRFAQEMECIFRLTGFICSFLSSGLGLILASSQYWRLWEFDNNVVQLVYIGLWEAYYYLEFNTSSSVNSILVHTRINSTWNLSPEFRCAQGLTLLAMFIKPVVVIFSSASIRVNIIKAPVSKIQILSYKCCVIILILSSICTVLSVTWNHVVDLYGETTLDFPPTFPVKKADLIKKHHTHVFPIGIMTAILSLLGMIMFLLEIRSLKRKSNSNSQHASKQADQKA